MALLDRVWPWRRKSDPLQALFDLYGGHRMSSASGKPVTWQTALQASTWMACASVLAEGVALPPFQLTRDAGGKRLPATDHSLYAKLALRPNPYQTSFEFRETMMLHLVFTGQAFIFKNAPAGSIYELLLLDPGSMTLTPLSDGSVKYEYTNREGKRREIPAESMWHIRGKSWNGWQGLDGVALAREAIGLALAIEESQAKFYANGARPSAILSVEGTLGEKQYDELRKWLDKEVVGAENTARPQIMDRSAKLMPWAMSSVDAQLVELRNQQVQEVCRAARVMPIMVGYTDKAATYASAVEMFVQHVRGTMAPWWERIEQSANSNLLTERERSEGLYFNFVEEGMLRGSPIQMKDVVLAYVNGGIITPNEGRGWLDLNPDTDPKSNQLRVPANIVGEPDQPKQPDKKPGE